MASSNFREQSLASAGPVTNCATCTTSSLKAATCAGAVIVGINMNQGYNGTSLVMINSAAYSAGDVVWVTTSAAGPRECAEIIGITPVAANVFMDEAMNSGSGPYANCGACSWP